MEKRYYISLQAFLFFALVGFTSNIYAAVHYNEQILGGNGGASGAISGEWTAVGAYDPLDAKSCEVAIYRLDYATMTWNLHTASLSGKSGNCNGNKGFGAAISLSGTRLAVGLDNYDDRNNKNVGAFDLYEYDSASDSWNLVAGPIVANDADGLSGYGSTLSVQGDYLIVGAPYQGVTDNGKVYVYDWTLVKNLGSGLPPVASVSGSQVGELLGSSVTGDGTEVIVGAPGYNSGFGAGFIYEVNAGSGTLTQIGAVYGSAGESLGQEIAKKGDIALLSGTTITRGYLYYDAAWQNELSKPLTLGGDVSTSSGVSAVAGKGSSVSVYPSIHSSYNGYAVTIVPLLPGLEYGEDISLSENILLVSDFGQDQVHMYEMPCGFGGTLEADTWKMVSIPCKISGQTVGSIFGDDGLGTYGTNWVVYEQNASNYSGRSADAIMLDESSPVVQGKSYWIIADANVTWKVDSAASTTRTDLDTALVPYPNLSAGVYALALPAADQNLSGNASWSKVMIGNPFARTFEWGNVQYSTAADGNIALDTAELSGYMDSTAYVYDSAVVSGQPYEAIQATPGFNRPIGVNEGLWVKMLNNATSSDQLLIPFEK